MSCLNGLRFFAMTILISPCYAERIQIGSTYSVEEENAITVIKQKVTQVNWEKQLDKVNVQKTLQRFKRTLPRTQSPRQRRYIPFYELTKEIPDKNGNTLYPKGFRYNPLDYFFMPGRIIVIGDTPADITWLKTKRKSTDRIITAGGDVRTLQSDHNITAFLFEEKMKTRLGIKKIPSIIWQEGNELVIQEFVVEEKILVTENASND